MKVVTDQQKNSKYADVQASALYFKQHLISCKQIQEFQPHKGICSSISPAQGIYFNQINFCPNKLLKYMYNTKTSQQNSSNRVKAVPKLHLSSEVNKTRS